MSGTTAIAAATLSLRKLLEDKVPERDSAFSGPSFGPLKVTTYPLDVANKNGAGPKLNLFLYETAINAAWRNMDIPHQVRSGESGPPPLALDLHFLLTAFGSEADDDAASYRLLGGAMSVLHDHPVLNRDFISNALSESGLGEQFERLRVTPLPIAWQEMSTLWQAFQTNYRLSAAYGVTVVLIDSTRDTKSALPVLRRGSEDRGVTAVAGAAPRLKEIQYPRSQPAARLGEEIAIAGERLTAADAKFRFTSPRLKDPVELVPNPGSDSDELAVNMPDEVADVSRWVPGFYTVALVLKKTGVPPIASNQIAFALAPEIKITNTTITPHAPQPDPPLWDVQVKISCEPNIASDQRVLLLLGDRQVERTAMTPPAGGVQLTALTFEVKDVRAGKHVVRLRVDGADSIPVVYTDEDPPIPSFDPDQTVDVP